ncbi:DUF4272 domain-containing protein [Hymenobacter sp. HSC-4F20]|uniref:DUF4272 domain-containing protein n=1 Tax=Hymenobacter sp. HSC-4F20 TaxID=2864135 RepID=UPI001C7399B7|nr:DUF4272 domain-containing protein [Hymenobacter sp. HSC-4F20]MBX0292067.1 DUF4272 domain-containing protein [Hymenobacter sp. HSC-4F20]
MRTFQVLFLSLALGSCSHNNQPEAAANLTVPVEQIAATPDQQARRAKSEAYCKAHAIPMYSNPTALFVDSEAEATIRTKDEVVDRALALCYIGLKGEGLAQRYLDKMDRDYHITSKLTPIELAFATAAHPTEQQRTDATWRYESLHVMLWALSFVDDLPYPNQMCDVAHDAKIIHDLSEKEFRQKAKLRSKQEILDQADLILRLDWACTDARVTNAAMPGNLDQGIVYERHHSLNWLITYMNQAWDDVSTDT